MISCLVWESPYIAKSYGRTCRRQNSSNLTPKIYSFAFLHKKLSNYYKSIPIGLQKYKINRTFAMNHKKIKVCYIILEDIRYH